MNNKNSKHRWCYNEDKYACDLFINYCIIKEYFDIEVLYKLFNQSYPNIKFSSFVMKIQNIVQICIEKNLLLNKNHPISPLRNYSQQNLLAFENSFFDNQYKLNNINHYNNLTKVYVLNVCDSYGIESVKLYISETNKEIDALKILPYSALAKELVNKKVGDVFKINETEYTVEKIQDMEII